MLHKFKRGPSRRRERYRGVLSRFFFFSTAFTCRLDNSQEREKTEYVSAERKKGNDVDAAKETGERVVYILLFFFILFWYACAREGCFFVINRKNKGVADLVSVLRPPFSSMCSFGLAVWHLIASRKTAAHYISLTTFYAFCRFIFLVNFFRSHRTRSALFALVFQKYKSVRTTVYTLLMLL